MSFELFPGVGLVHLNTVKPPAPRAGGHHPPLERPRRARWQARHLHQMRLPESLHPRLPHAVRGPRRPLPNRNAPAVHGHPFHLHGYGHPHR